MHAQLACALFPAIAFAGPRPQAAESWKHEAGNGRGRLARPAILSRTRYSACAWDSWAMPPMPATLTQDTFAKALAHATTSDHPEHMQAWLLRIARNSCLDQMRRLKVRGPLQPLSEFSAVCWQTPEDLAGSAEEIRIVRRAIARLPRRLRDVLVMREYGELSCQEIGGAMGIGHGTVSKRLKRARQLVLRYYLEEQK